MSGSKDSAATVFIPGEPNSSRNIRRGGSRASALATAAQAERPRMVALASCPLSHIMHRQDDCSATELLQDRDPRDHNYPVKSFCSDFKLNATYRPNCEIPPMCSRFQLPLVCLAHFLPGIFPYPHNLISFLLTDREENVLFFSRRNFVFISEDIARQTTHHKGLFKLPHPIELIPNF